MRSADNSKYGENITSGLVVKLDSNTKESDIYDKTGMTVQNYGPGQAYLVQDPSMLTTPSKELQTLIQQSTGGSGSQYSWAQANGNNAPAQSTGLFSTNNPYIPSGNACMVADCIPVGRPNSGPDYFSAQLSFYVLSGSVAVNLHNGDMFGGIGLARSYPAYSTKPGLSASLGSIVGGGGAQATSEFLGGGGGQAGYFAPLPVAPWLGVGGGFNHSYGGATAMEVGISVPPGGGVSPAGYAVPVKQKDGK